MSNKKKKILVLDLDSIGLNPASTNMVFSNILNSYIFLFLLSKDQLKNIYFIELF